jgi:hypothetical protein
MKAKKNTTSLNDDFDIDDIDSPELTDEFFKNAITFSELPEDLQIILKSIQHQKPTKITEHQILDIATP